MTTSNIQPHQLYKDGLQRAKFLPAIALIERHCEVRELQSAQDFRLRALTSSGIYFTPDDDDAERAMSDMFERIAPGARRTDAPVHVNGRDIPVRRRADAMIWFDFAALCEGPRAVADYIELAQSYNTVLVSHVPQFTPLDGKRGAALHQSGRRVLRSRRQPRRSPPTFPLPICIAASACTRNSSARAAGLIEMQSEEYLSAAHRH